jgi:hypothetical protein
MQICHLTVKNKEKNQNHFWYFLADDKFNSLQIEEKTIFFYIFHFLIKFLLDLIYNFE